MHLKTFIFSSLIALALPAFAQVDIDAIGTLVPRFRQVTASIYAGGNPSSKSEGTGLDAIAVAGIYSMINLQGGDVDNSISGWVSWWRQPGESREARDNERLLWEMRGLEWYNFPLKSHAPKTELEDLGIRRALEIMAAATPEKPVYVHCEHGADRTGLLIALHRVLHLGWTPEEANAEWVRNGHGRVSRYFTGYLDDYFWKVVRERGSRAPQTVADCSKRAS